MLEEDSQPLLGDGATDVSKSKKPGKWTPASQVKELLKSQRKKTIEDVFSPDQINISASSSLNKLASDPPENIVAVFVVTFDTRCGNVVEWSIPEDVDLTSVEFKAMPSGAHTVESDFLYFHKDNLYGLSCFEKMSVCSEEERGARMKSVGVLTYSYTTLHRCLQFLEQQVRHQLVMPGDYQQLIAFYDDKKGVLSPCDESNVISSFSRNRNQEELPEMTITHPAGCFSQFIRFFGENIFALWKLTLLQKRILFFSPPPIGVVCYRVYCAACLARHDFTREMRKLIKPYFYVNIADIEQLESEVSYIACTTEKIFEEKKELYDVYIDNRRLCPVSPALKDIIKVNRSDEEKYQQLLNHRQEHIFLERIGESEHQNEEQMFVSFFSEQNNRLFQTLFDVASSDERTLTSEHMRAMGLDPTADRQFVMMILELYDINLLMVVDNPCCPV